MRTVALGSLVLAVLFAGAVLIGAVLRPPAPAALRPDEMGGMAGMPASGNLAPLVKGFYAGGEIGFIHTEASDADVAGMLTRMMGPQVVLVPSLAQAGPDQLARVFVFTNGVLGDGPFGYQPDVFDAVPGDPGYRPLRAVNLVTWRAGAQPRVLRSVDDLRQAEAGGLLSISKPGVVVNMPVLTWPGGRR